jgi:putative membrane protein
MRKVIVSTLVTAVAVWAAVRFVPDISFPAANAFPDRFPEGDWWQIVVVAVLIGLVNSYVKPLVGIVSLPANLVTMGLFGLVMNGLLLLAVAYVSDAVGITFTIGGFPPNLGLDAVVAAVLASIVISVVSTILELVTAPVR